MKSLRNNPQNYLIFDITIIFFCSALIFVIAQFNREFVQFESRFALFAQEMWRNGISLFPTTYNQFYPDYPATQTILSYLFSLLIGKVTSLTAILPTAITSAITLVFTYLIGAIRSRYWAWYSVFILLLTFTYLVAARSIALDQFTTTATVISFYLIYSAKELNNTKRLYFLPAVWIIGFIMRGPIGLIIPTSITSGYYLIEKKWSAFAKICFISVMLFALCVAALLFAAWHTAGTSFMHNVMRSEALGRMNGLTINSDGPYLWIALENYAISFPLAILILIAHFKQIFNLNNNNKNFCLLRHVYFWIFIVMVGLSIPLVTKVRYILPIAPACALASAYLFVTDEHPKYLLILRQIFLSICVILPFIGLLALLACFIYGQINHLSLQINYYAVSGVLIILTIISFMSWKKFLNKLRQRLTFLACAAATFITLYIGVIQPLDVQFNSVKPFVEAVNSFWKAGQALVFYKIGPDQEDIKFMTTLNQPVIPLFIKKPDDLLNFKAPAIIIARDENFVQFTQNQQHVFKLLAQLKLGHNLCDILVRNNSAA